MKTLIEIMSIGIFAIGLSAIIGYVLDFKCLYSMTTNPMALNAAIAILLIGATLFLIGKKL